MREEETTFLAHVLFIDLVQFTVHSNSTQARVATQLASAVQETHEVKTARYSDRVIILPTGDGAALAFMDDPVSAVRCAEELASILGDRFGLHFRMGIHSGPVIPVSSSDLKSSIVGSGMNLAERVMRCALEDQILISETAADLVMQSGGWDNRFVPLGSRTLKHGKRLNVFALFPESATPASISRLRHKLYFSALARKLQYLALFSVLSLYLIALPWLAITGHLNAQRAEAKLQKVVDQLSDYPKASRSADRDRAAEALWRRKNLW